MAEITNLFKATVKTVKSRQKAQGLTTGPDKSILSHSKPKTEFSTKSKEVIGNITELKDFLMTHRKDYVNAFNHLGRGTTKMSDTERDQIDSGAEGHIRQCSEAIKTLRSEDLQNKTCPQVKEHRVGVLKLIEMYLKSVCTIYSEQRAVRVKRVVDKQRISRLEPEKKRSKTFQSEVANEVKKSVPMEGSRISQEDLTPDEIAILEQENMQLYGDMNSMVDEVKQVEGKVVEISRLQEIFAEKVLEQEKDIDRIAQTTVGSTENIKEANEEIREAMKNNAGLRVWILFFLIVCSFSLLFLDWYNP